MNNQMNNREFRIWFTLIGLIAIAAILAGIWAAVSFEGFGFVRRGGIVPPLDPRPIPSYTPGDFQFYYIARTALSTVNIALLIILAETYATIYIKTRSQFTIGLLIFSVVFLIKEVTSSPFVIGAIGFAIYGLGPFALLEPMLEAAALSVLLYLSIKY